MTVLLVIIYIAFISLGLPDSLLGSAWPAMYEGFGVQIWAGGAISMVVAAGTIVSSLLSARLIRRLGTGLLTTLSVCMTAVALLGISFAPSFLAVCLWAVPLGLGAGSVDAGLNNFVALHYKASHMNWLHSFWGIGTIIGPLIISASLSGAGTWNGAYRTISYLQFLLVAILAATLPLWKKAKKPDDGAADRAEAKPIGLLGALRLPAAGPTLVAFFCYCGLEQTVNLWGSSFLVVVKGIREEIAAGWISLFFIGITVGRLLAGFLAYKIAQRRMILIGQSLIAVGVLLFLLPLPTLFLATGLFFVGLGCAPIFPSMLHETPRVFGQEHSQAVMGIQMASAYLGTTLLAPLFGLLGGRFGYGWFPFYLGALLLVMVVMVRTVHVRQRRVEEKQ